MFSMFLGTSAGSSICGMISLMLVYSLTIFPSKEVREYINPVIEDPGFYQLNVESTGKKEATSDFNISKNELIFQSIILEAANRHEVDPDLVKAVIMAESGYNPMAISKKGAIGLMQLMPATANDLGVKDLFDPERNVNAGVRYLKRLLIQFDGNIQLALAAYNAGSRKVKKYQGIPPFKSTRYYVKKVFQYYQYYQGRKV